MAGEDADVVLAHLPGDGREDERPVVDLHPEHRARERLDDLAFDLDFLFFYGQTASSRGLDRAGRANRGTSRNRPRQSGGSAVRAYRSKTGAAVRIRGPAAVTATVCSKWAESEPSAVEIDHSSSCRTMSAPPALIIGSIANVIPS